MKNRDIYYRRHKIQEASYIGQLYLSPLQSRHLWDLTHFSQSPSAAPSYFPESHWQSEISSLSKVILVLGKARSHRAPNLGCRGAGPSGWFDVSPKNCRGHNVWALPWWSISCPWLHLLNLPNSSHRGVFKLNIEFDTHSFLYSLSHFECDSHTVPMLTLPHLLPPMKVQWSRQCSHMHIPVHSPWLPGYIDVA